jgi:hypothetical protein
MELDGQPCAAGAVDQFADLRDPGHGRGGRAVVRVAQHAEQLAQFGKRGAPACSETVERYNALTVGHRRHTRRRLSLHDQHRHVVRDDVVQFARDALALHEARRFHRLGLLGPQRGVAALQRSELVAARPQ